MGEAEFGDWLDGMRPALEAWGDFIVARVTELVKLDLGDEAYKPFFKIPPGYRSKDRKSAVKKLKKKKYAQPKEQMTDLVGARFVVLLKTDIEIVERAIVGQTGWAISRDRNPVDEQAKDPTSFEYQSVHYLLRNNKEFVHKGVTIPEGLSCEVQIRTVLQHAYAELGHDRIYKGEQHVPLSVQRLVARCMALMETTDEMFVNAVHELDQVNREIEHWCAFLDETLKPILTTITPTCDDHEARDILDTYKDLLKEAGLDSVKADLTPFVTKKIQERASRGGLFAKPVVLAVYWLVKTHPFEVSQIWPVPGLRNELDQVKADLGVA
jgi:ppGpp synthetase/RelA/SpoT-type nucleotidyltranferase